MKDDDYRELRRLTKKYRIYFDGPVDSDKWPSAYERLFRNIKLLGKTSYHEYKELKKAASVDAPWGAYAVKRAERIADLAERCRSENRNEAGWRLVMEPEIFARFTVEVACPKCRARIWRSEIEVETENTLNEGPRLEERRKRRKPCHCPPESRQLDFNDIGLNRLFSDRAEELVVHDEVIKSEVPKKDHPDRVYGLRETKVFEKALSAPFRNFESDDAQDRPVREAVQSSPFRQLDDALIFPFLILEAKSEMGESFASIEMQTALSIRTLIKMQEDLQRHCDYQLKWQDGPLVWFLANRGDEWRVAATYVETVGQDTKEVNYRTIELWSGRLVSRDGALQLLLIIDHIFDWARDVYRCAVLDHLRLLSAADPSDVLSVANDSDIFSMANPIKSWIDRTQTNTAPAFAGCDGVEETVEAIRPMRELDSREGVFRHSKFIDSEFLGLHVTGDNVGTMLQSFNTPTQAKQFARKLLRVLSSKKTLSLTEATLNELENSWTGGASHFDNPLTPDTEFVVRMLFRTYLTDDWNQVRELSYVAVSRDGLEVLMARSGLMRPFRERGAMCEQQSVIEMFRQRQTMSSISNLHAAISRVALSLEMTSEKSSEDNPIEQLRFEKEEREDQAYTIIREVYRKNQVGMRAVTEPFIRTSSRTDEQALEGSLDTNNTDTTGTPGNCCLTNQKFVLLVGNCVQVSGFTSYPTEVCFYVVSGPPVIPPPSLVMKALQKILEENNRIHITLRYSKPSLSAKWNLENVYTTADQHHIHKLDALIKHLSEKMDWFRITGDSAIDENNPAGIPGFGGNSNLSSENHPRAQTSSQQDEQATTRSATPIVHIPSLLERRSEIEAAFHSDMQKALQMSLDDVNSNSRSGQRQPSGSVDPREEEDDPDLRAAIALSLQEMEESSSMEMEESSSMEMPDAPSLVDSTEDMPAAQGLIENRVHNHSVPDYNFTAFIDAARENSGSNV